MKPTTRLLAQFCPAGRLGMFVLLLLGSPVKGAVEPLVLPVWPGAVPGDSGTIGPERVRAPSEAPTKDAKWITDVSKPTITVFRPARRKDTGTATHFDQRAYEPIDEIDQASCRPDFAVAVYPGYLIEQQPAGVEINHDVLAPYIRIPKDTPPILLVHATDDPVAGAENGVVMCLALKRANVPTELHIYAQGGHGFGVRKSSLPCSTWPDRCVAWLQTQGLLAASGQTK